MKKIFAVIAFICIGISWSNAQDIPAMPAKDSVQHEVIVYHNIFDDLAKPGENGATVKISQPEHLKQALYSNIAKNEKGNMLDGYRIRIYSDNSQNSRQYSEYLVGELETKYPNVKAYRSYSNPYFRVSIGDFRTLNDARGFLDIIKIEYPKAYPVKEKINLPPL